MGGRGASGGGTSRYSVGETIRSAGYEIKGGFVTSPSGRTISVENYRELTDAERRQAARLGVEDPVLVGRMAMPRAIAEQAIEQRTREAAAIRQNVPGLEELRNARAYDETQRDRFSRSVYSGSGRLQGNPSSNTAAEVAQKYPRAAAYLHAESWSYASNDVKASLGRIARNQIASGRSYKSAISEMEKKWKKYLDRKSRSD